MRGGFPKKHSFYPINLHAILRVKKLIYFICFYLMFSSMVGAQCPEITGKNLYRTDQINRLQNLAYTVSEDMVDQMLDLYIPSPMKDCEQAKLILVIHGGGFVSGNKEIVSSWGYNFARKGYYVAVINYRLFVNSHSEIENYVMEPFLVSRESRCDKAYDISLIDGIYNADKAWYSAVQDCRAALSYCQFALEELGKKLEKLYVLGESAGAMSALGLTYGQQEDFSSFNPDLEKVFGDLNSQIKYPITNTKEIDMIIGISGGLLNAKDFFSKKDSVPALFFHGGKDHGVPLCDKCTRGERSVNGPLKIASIIEENDIALDYEIHIWENEAHDLRNKYNKISELMMDRISGNNKSIKKLNLYPESALFNNCQEAELNAEISKGNSFISKKYSETGLIVSVLDDKAGLKVQNINTDKGSVNLRLLSPLGDEIKSVYLPKNGHSELVLEQRFMRAGIYFLIASYIDEQYSEKIKIILRQ